MKKKSNLQKVITPEKGDSEATLEIKRYIGAITEEYQSRVGAVAEVLTGINDKIEVMNDKIEVMNDKIEVMNDTIEVINNKIEVINGNIGEINRKLDVHTEMIGTLMEDMTVVKEDIVVIKSELKKKVDYDEFLALERRMSLLEAKMRQAFV